MAAIAKIGDRWRAQVRRAGRKSKSKTFDTKREAEAWGRQIETALDAEAAVIRSDDLTVEKLIDEYRKLRIELGRPVDPTSNTHYMLQHLADDLGRERISDLTPQLLARWAKQRAKDGAGGYTVNMELSQLGTAIRHTASFLSLTLPDVVGAARPLLHYGQLITGGNRRTRRPSADELARLLEALDARNPIIADAVRVAAITGMRRGELARIAWKDVDERARAVLVRARKHPRRVEARDEWVPLLGDAWAIVQRQARTDVRIFPVSREALTDAVTETTAKLGIPNLHLHDMRREATSALRDMGFDADARKAIVGHRTDKAHEIYVDVSLESLHSQFDASRDSAPRQPRPRKGSGRRP